MNNFLIVTLALAVLLQLSCGDILNRNKHIISNYYLCDGEDQFNYLICWEVEDGAGIGKTPRGVITYSLVDSFLVAKILDEKKATVFYVINMNKDSAFAKEEDFRYGPLTLKEFEGFKIDVNRINWIKP